MNLISLRRPESSTGIGDGAYSYSGIGSTTVGSVPPGYRVDTAAGALGTGPATYAAARAAIDGWAMFGMPWVHIEPVGTPIESGRVVCVTARTFGVWVRGRCRIVDVIDRDDGVLAEYGFSHATLRDHPARGEERFLVRWDRSTDEVVFDLLAHSRPAQPLFWMAYPVLRARQARFRRESVAAIQAATG